MTEMAFRDRILKLLPQVKTPGQYLGNEPGAVVKPADSVRGTCCLAFPDAYSIGMSHHGLQVLYAAMNRLEHWSCQRVFAPLADFEQVLRDNDLPLYALETFKPLRQFDILGFTLQYELCLTNVLTMLDLGRIPLHSTDRSLDDPLVVAGGPSVSNPEPMSEFIDVFLIGDGEECLPMTAELYLKLRDEYDDRQSILCEIARQLPFAYVPSCYLPIEDSGQGGDATESESKDLLPTTVVPCCEGVPTYIIPGVVEDLDAQPLPTNPVVPLVECVQDRIAIEIARGCPGVCRFCQSTTIKRPIRHRSVETIVNAAVQSYENTGYDEISLLSLSTSDYPELETLIRRLQEVFRPLNVAISVPSLRINEQLRTLPSLLGTDRHSGLTIAPEAARDDMRRQIGKRITNDDLLAGCRDAFAEGFHRVKLYFMCGLPGERRCDLDGIIELSEEIARLGREVRGRSVTVVANVSNMVPKPQTPYQYYPMQTGDYFRWAHRYLRSQLRMRSVKLQCHDVETSLLEGMICRGDRQMGEAIEAAWRAGAKFDAWSEHFNGQRWWDAIEAVGIDPQEVIGRTRNPDEPLPWNHICISSGSGYLRRHYNESIEQLAELAEIEPPAEPE